LIAFILKRPALHYLALATLLLGGLLLRFWQLDSKPLWLDEVLTALFSMGQSQQDVPLNVFFPLTALDRIFSVQPGVSCAQITQTVSTESVHPPLFFCLLYSWMNWLQPDNWVWGLRALPALFGVGTIAALYWLNRVAFSPRVGLAGAALMAVSPFAVYLSQEARHYTLPMLLITLGLVGLVKMQQDLAANRLRPWVWLGWCGVNSIGLYTHYFCTIALIAQVLALLGWMLWQRSRLGWQHWWAIGLAIGGVFLSYLPWLPTLFNHFSRPETDWLIPYKPDWQDRIAPLYQTLVNWVLMVIVLPVEDQPDGAVLLWGIVGLVFAGWLGWQIYRGWRKRWQHNPSRAPMLLLLGFNLGVILQFFAIVYLLDKDLTVVPRYNFVYYPGVCALLGACLTAGAEGERQKTGGRKEGIAVVRRRRLHPLVIILLASLLSSCLVVNGVVFQKSYYPDRVAKTMAFEPDRSLIAVTSYESLQEVALGLSFALELQKLYPPDTIDSQVRFGFLDRSNGYGAVWRAFPDLDQSLPLPLNLWVVASPGMRTKDYPERLRINDRATPRRKALCRVDPDRFERIGFPYQLFRCESRKSN
jgi:uncharacterized membrane protein